jgi:hypothetical protein
MIPSAQLQAAGALAPAGTRGRPQRRLSWADHTPLSPFAPKRNHAEGQDGDSNDFNGWHAQSFRDIPPGDGAERAVPRCPE